MINEGHCICAYFNGLLAISCMASTPSALYLSTVFSCWFLVSLLCERSVFRISFLAPVLTFVPTVIHGLFFLKVFRRRHFAVMANGAFPDCSRTGRAINHDRSVVHLDGLPVSHASCPYPEQPWKRPPPRSHHSQHSPNARRS